MIAEILLKIRHFYFSLRGIHFHPESVISGVPIRSFRLVGKYGNINLRCALGVLYSYKKASVVIGDNVCVG